MVVGDLGGSRQCQDPCPLGTSPGPLVRETEKRAQTLCIGATHVPRVWNLTLTLWAPYCKRSNTSNELAEQLYEIQIRPGVSTGPDRGIEPQGSAMSSHCAKSSTDSGLSTISRLSSLRSQT